MTFSAPTVAHKTYLLRWVVTCFDNLSLISNITAACSATIFYERLSVVFLRRGGWCWGHVLTLGLNHFAAFPCQALQP